MEFSGSGLLTLTVFFPLIGALILILFIRNVKVIPYFVVAIGMIELLLTVVVFFTYDLEGPRFQIIDKLDGWIPIDSFNIQYFDRQKMGIMFPLQIFKEPDTAFERNTWRRATREFFVPAYLGLEDNGQSFLDRGQALVAICFQVYR